MMNASAPTLLTAAALRRLVRAQTARLTALGADLTTPPERLAAEWQLLSAMAAHPTAASAAPQRRPRAARVAAAPQPATELVAPAPLAPPDTLPTDPHGDPDGPASDWTHDIHGRPLSDTPLDDLDEEGNEDDEDPDDNDFVNAGTDDHAARADEPHDPLSERRAAYLRYIALREQHQYLETRTG